MLCSFTIRFRSLIWFLIFTFTLYSIPHFEYLFPYKFHLFNDAEATVGEVDESKIPNQGEAPADAPAEEPSPKDPPAAPTAASEPEYSQLSGAPTASFKVDDFTGAAHMTYPIAVPPGRSGLSPNLSLTYNSNNGNGWIGVGWDIPTGYIQRRGPRKGVPKYDDTKDVYELNLGGSAQELVHIGSNQYRLKIEGAYLKIVYYPDPQNYWEVWDKSGTKMRFGYNTDVTGSRLTRTPESFLKSNTYRWYLDRVEDPKTNYMEVYYESDGYICRPTYLKEIKYNAQVSGPLPHNHRVLFNLETSNRPDPIYNYRGGFRILTLKRLSSVEIRTNDNLVRKYQLQYAIPNARSVLSSITVYGSDGTSTLPPVQFTYQTHITGFEGEATLWPNPSAWASIAGNYIRNTSVYGTSTDVIDMDGNALLDRVVYSKPGYCTDPSNGICPWFVYENIQTGFLDLGDPEEPNWPNPSAWDAINGNLIRNTSSSGYGTFTDVIDMNGDALPDRVVYKRSCTPPYATNCPWTVYWNNNGTGFENVSQGNWPNPSAWTAINGNYIRDMNTSGYGAYTDVIDMNGDGLPDRVVYDSSSPYTMWKVYYNNGNGFDGGVDWSNPSQWGSINGNYIRNNIPGTGIFTDVIDMNGDGLPDRVVYDRTAPYTMWKVYFNNGNGFDAGMDWSNPSGPAPVGANHLRWVNAAGVKADLIDMNGDGLPDRVVYCDPVLCDTWTVYFNNGSGFVSPGVPWHSPWIKPTVMTTPGNYISDVDALVGTQTAITDINGDGLPDRVVYDRSSPYTDWSIYRNNGPVADLLKKVENGIGGCTEITYAPSTNYDNIFLPFVVQTVSSYIQKDGMEPESSYLYKNEYSGGYYDPAEVEFRGFQTVTSKQMANETEYESMTVTTFHQDYYLKGKVQTQVLTSAEGHMRQVENIWFVQDNENGTRFPRLDQTTSTITDVGQGGPFTYSHRGTYSYDSYFNVSEEHSGTRKGHRMLRTFELILPIQIVRTPTSFRNQRISGLPMPLETSPAANGWIMIAP